MARKSADFAARLNDFGPFDIHNPVAAELEAMGIRPTGQDIFDSLAKVEQDEMLGPEAATMVREGEATLADFVDFDGGFITQKPVTALEGKAATKREYVRDRQGRFAETAGSGDDKPKIPQWKRDRRYNGWVRSLSPEEQEVLARQFYEKLWKELRAYFGAFGELPPNMVFTDNIPEQFQGLVFQDEKGMRQVQLRPSQVLELALHCSTSDGSSRMTSSRSSRMHIPSPAVFST
jgi:hypothetical protein